MNLFVSHAKAMHDVPYNYPMHIMYICAATYSSCRAAGWRSSRQTQKNVRDLVIACNSSQPI